ncbi:MAG: ribonuclease J [Holosporales bacterium]|nr:ribonuclease J [Holosporales bacterium]
MNYVPTDNDLVFVPLGGTNEVGMVLGMIGHDGEWLIIDCGITFYSSLGIDILTANPTFASRQNSRIKGMLITHAHEDHIGAIEYLWPVLRCPVYVTPFAAAVLRQKLETKSWASKVNITEIQFEGKFSVGKFQAEAIQMAHSIPESAAFVITTPLGTVVHAGDWRFDQTPVIGKKVNESKLEKVGKGNVLAYLGDSTNIFTPSDPSSESIIRENLLNLVKKHSDKRITIACFASNIARAESSILAAEKTGRKIAIVGWSLKKMFAAAQETWYLKEIPHLIDEKTAMSMPPNKVLMLCTGSQGEISSALVRIASGKHPIIKMNEDDIVFFSSRVIPGNEKSIGELHNLLAIRKVDIITSSEENIHASGHPSRESIAKMYKLLKPKAVIPVHGEARHLIAQAHFARDSGIKHVITPHNGSIIQLAGAKPEIIGEVQTGKWAVDGNRMVAFEGSIMQERLKLSEQGAVFATVITERDGIKRIEIGIIGLEERGKPFELLESFIRDEIKANFGKLQGNSSNTRTLESVVSASVAKKIGKRPIVAVHIVTV